MMSMKNSNDTIGNRTRYLPARGHAVAQLVEALRYKSEGTRNISWGVKAAGV
jgi:hypothetical protein